MAMLQNKSSGRSTKPSGSSQLCDVLLASMPVLSLAAANPHRAAHKKIRRKFVKDRADAM